jgi:hypothetical protein
VYESKEYEDLTKDNVYGSNQSMLLSFKFYRLCFFRDTNS